MHQKTENPNEEVELIWDYKTDLMVKKLTEILNRDEPAQAVVKQINTVKTN